ncbi:MAG: dihydrolipoyl dehydrogenase [Deltaproteobacteria bacterium]|nr:dihydrolipoyl dehydrogenase [Deltaproteobacteria bacterium]
MKPNDVVIIGGGPAGYVAAIRVSQLGGKAILIEKDSLGGTCLNRGCIPTKALLHSVGILEAVRKANDYGVTVGEIVVDFVKMMNRKDRIVNTMVKNIGSLMKSNAVDVINGQAEVISPTEVAVDHGQRESVKCDRIILAPGSVPSSVPIPGVEGSGVITSNEALQLSKVPQSLLIIGGGVIGVEFATIFAKLGTKVTIVEMLPQIIPTEDPELAGALKRILERSRIKIFTGTQVTRIEDDSEGNKLISVTNGEAEEVLMAELVLVAVGRKPNIEGLGLESVGIKTERGKILVNDRMETNVPGIYAAGDAIGGVLLAHVASAEGEVAAENALGKDSVMDYTVVPHCIYTAPEVASIGLTENQAREKGIDFKVGNFPFAANPKAMIIGQRDGFVKIVSDAGSGDILGIHIFGHQATELIAEAAVALKLKASVADVAATIHAHPSLSETVREAVLDAQGIPIHMPKRP